MRKVFNQINIPILGVNAEGYVVYSNPSAESILAYRVGDSVNSLRIVDKFRHVIFAKNNPLSNPSALTNLDHKWLLGFVTHDNEFAWFSVRPLLNKEDNGVYFVSFTDVTEFVSKEQTIRNQLTALTLSERNTKVGTWRFELESEKIYWSPEVFRIFEYPGPQTPNFATYLGLLVESEQKELQSLLMRAQTEKEPYEVVQHIETKTGRKTLRAWGQPQLGADGNVYALIGTVSDITESMRKIHKLQKLATVAEKTLTAVVITDEHGLTEWVNDGFVAMTGYTLDEVKGKKPGDLLQGEGTDPETVRTIRRLLAEAKPVDIDILNYRKSGEPYWNQLLIQPSFGVEGLLDGFYAIQVDVTENRLMSRRLQTISDQLRVTVALKDQLFSVIGHDLRSSFSTIVGFSELLIQDFEALPSAQVKDFLASIYRGAQENLSLVDNLLHWALAKSQKLTVEFEWLDMNAIVKGVLATSDFAIQQKKLQVILDCPSGLTIGGDRRMVTSIGQNLINNAIKYSFDKGKIWITITKEPKQTVFRVVDEGPGLSADECQILFDLQIRESKPGTRGEVGTGFGLSLVKQFVDLHKGIVRADPREPHGLCVEICLPSEN